MRKYFLSSSPVYRNYYSCECSQHVGYTSVLLFITETNITCLRQGQHARFSPDHRSLYLLGNPSAAAIRHIFETFGRPIVLGVAAVMICIMLVSNGCAVRSIVGFLHQKRYLDSPQKYA